mmetsp:Transcript_4301/g.8430  ORF Transcript_4301/g.8430 Transcript_4301/m.8430 type:complete len:261 (+) Transcript_4301:301-1083(+)
MTARAPRRHPRAEDHGEAPQHRVQHGHSLGHAVGARDLGAREGAEDGSRDVDDLPPVAGARAEALEVLGGARLEAARERDEDHRHHCHVGAARPQRVPQPKHRRHLHQPDDDPAENRGPGLGPGGEALGDLALRVPRRQHLEEDDGHRHHHRQGQRQLPVLDALQQRDVVNLDFAAGAGGEVGGEGGLGEAVDPRRDGPPEEGEARVLDPRPDLDEDHARAGPPEGHADAQEEGPKGHPDETLAVAARHEELPHVLEERW